MVQTLQGAGVSAEVRAAIVGHELDDEHHAAYSTKSPTKAAMEALAHGLVYRLDLAATRPLLHETKSTA
ncbi:phage-related integrase [mine drainage metagenome]|uniref:Phage-related integrase n=1 Tax=mine drainage metagenome TaxID=410659 RepID=T1C6U6_9ZZZZ